MKPYRPAFPEPVSFGAGIWSAAGRTDRSVTVTLDPRLLSWFVQQAARRGDHNFKVNIGTPAFTVSLA